MHTHHYKNDQASISLKSRHSFLLNFDFVFINSISRHVAPHPDTTVLIFVVYTHSPRVVKMRLYVQVQRIIRLLMSLYHAQYESLGRPCDVGELITLCGSSPHCHHIYAYTLIHYGMDKLVVQIY